MGDWTERYSKYLRTAAWGERRRRVLSRAKGLCERCRVRPASHVHHLTYQRLGNEPLSDLLALCWQCHNEEHPHRDFDPMRGRVAKHRRRKKKLTELDLAWIDFRAELKNRELAREVEERAERKGSRRRRPVSKQEKARRKEESQAARLAARYNRELREAEARWLAQG